MPYLPVETDEETAEDTVDFTPLPFSAACILTLIVSRGWIVDWDAALAVAPAMTSVTGNTLAIEPSKPVVEGAVMTDASTYPSLRRLPRRLTRLRGRLTRACRSTGKPDEYCSADMLKLALKHRRVSKDYLKLNLINQS